MNVRQKFEAFGILFAKYTIPLLPRIVVCKFSRFIGLLVYLAMPEFRHIAMANLGVVFGENKTAAEKRRIYIRSLQSITLTFLDLFWFNKNTHKRFAKYMKYEDSFLQAFNEPSTIFITAHFGSWEMLGIGSGIQDYPLASIATPLKNPVANRELNQLRTSTGSIIISRKGALRAVIRALKKGRATALLGDQNTLPEDGGVFVPFFGLPVPVTNIIGLLQTVVNSKIYITWGIPDSRGYYTACAKPPLDISPDMTREDITALATSELESVIYENPDYWLWAYKRWRYYRESDDKEKYPYYAESYEEYSEYRKLLREYRQARVVADDAYKEMKAFEAEDDRGTVEYR